MPLEIRGSRDERIEAIAAALEFHLKDHPRAEIVLSRYSPVSVRIRVIDPGFARMKRFERNDLIWDCLDRLSEEEQADVNMVLLLAPDEVDSSPGNMEFEHPVETSSAGV